MMLADAEWWTKARGHRAVTRWSVTFQGFAWGILNHPEECEGRGVGASVGPVDAYDVEPSFAPTAALAVVLATLRALVSTSPVEGE